MPYLCDATREEIESWYEPKPAPPNLRDEVRAALWVQERIWQLARRDPTYEHVKAFWREKVRQAEAAALRRSDKERGQIEDDLAKARAEIFRLRREIDLLKALASAKAGAPVPVSAAEPVKPKPARKPGYGLSSEALAIMQRPPREYEPGSFEPEERA